MKTIFVSILLGVLTGVTAISALSIWDAIDQGDLPTVQNFIENVGTSVEAKNSSSGQTLLERAVSQSQPEIVDYLIARGAKVVPLPSRSGQDLLSLAMTDYRKNPLVLRSLLKVWTGPLPDPGKKGSNLLDTAANDLERTVKNSQEYDPLADGFGTPPLAPGGALSSDIPGLGRDGLKNAFANFAMLYRYNSTQPAKSQLKLGLEVFEELRDYHLALLIAEGDVNAIQDAIADGEGLPDKALIATVFLADSPDILSLMQKSKQLSSDVQVTLANSMLYDSKVILANLFETGALASNPKAIYIWSLDSRTVQPLPADKTAFSLVDDLRKQAAEDGNYSVTHVVIGNILDLAVTLDAKAIIESLIESGQKGEHDFVRNLPANGAFVATSTFGAAMLANNENLAIELFQKGYATELNTFNWKGSMAVFPLLGPESDLALKELATSLKFSRLAPMLNW